MAMERLTFKSEKARQVYDIIQSMPPLTDEDAERMVKAIEKVTGRRHRVGKVKRHAVAATRSS
ncbi:hypothetical protein [Thermus caldilimi]|uniref:hypothetical protein n=1 Tax=Thermus caldilimi TaxID=2483360 RepID=UPI001076999E|nr:hypothetical protein [Thermus caldilimi]